MTTANPLTARMFGVVRHPRVTLEQVARAPRVADVLVATFLVSALSSTLLFQTETGRLALLDQWERTAVAFGQPIDNARYAAMQRATEHGIVYAGATAFASGPLLVGALAVLLFGAFRLAGEPGATLRQVCAIVAHAGVILMLRQVVASPLAYARETLASPTSLNLFFSMLDETSPLARFFGIIDLFLVWWLTVVAIGMSVLYRKPARQLAAAFMGVYALVAGVLTIVMALAGGTT